MSHQIFAATSRSVRLAITAAALGAALVSGCAIYKPEIAQGNAVTREQVAVLQPGMPRAQVAQVLGTPLLTDIFRPNRWDYVFTLVDRKGVEPQRYALTVFFEGDTLARVEGAESLPTENELVDILSSKKKYKERNLEADPAKLQAFAEKEKAQGKYKPEALPEAPSTTQFPALPD